MDISLLIFISALSVGVFFLLFLVIKSLITPKKIEGLQKLLKQGKNASAIKLAKSLIQKDSHDYMAHYYLGKAYLADKKSELALEEYKYVDKNALFDQKLPEASFRHEFASLLVKFNQPDEALKQFLLLTKLEPKNAENFYNTGKIYDQKNKPDLALGFYGKTISLNMRHINAHAAMGLILLNSKQITEAKREIDLAISLNPDTYSTYYYLGKILKENKDYAGAVKAFQKSERDPTVRQKSLIECGSCFMAGKSIENAMNCYERAISAGSENATETLYARYFLAACYEKTRKVEKAIEQWEKIYQKNHTFRDVASKLAEYKELQSNDSLKEYLISSEQSFYDICQKTCESALGLSPQQISKTKHGCNIIATEIKDTDWRSVRKKVFSIYFFRDSDPVEDSIIRVALDEVKSKSYTKAYICSSSGFTRSAMAAAENRPAELFGKEQLEALLDKASK